MRTTVSLDDDVLAVARSLATQRRVPLGSVISELARKGLQPTGTAAIRNGIRLFPVKKEAEPVTTDLVKRLLEETD